jgi:orotate phosphoribosyltransferase-like protein
MNSRLQAAFPCFFPKTQLRKASSIYLQMGIKIGVVGFSRNQFNKKEAHLKLKELLCKVMLGYENSDIELVSGYTSSGVPKIAYMLADELGIQTVGFSAKQALRVRSGLYPVKKVIIVGEKFGDESQSFVEYIDVLIRIGGGKQSRHEVELFKKNKNIENIGEILFEEEIEWYGN